MAPKDGRGHVEPAPDFALRAAVHRLREVVREPPPRARVRVACVRRRAELERRAGDGAEAQEEGAHEGRGERGGRAEARLVHLADGDAGGEEPGERAQRGGRGRQAARRELRTL